MTLDEYKEMLVRERGHIEKYIQSARTEEYAASTYAASTTEELANIRIKIQVQDGKLDMLNWLIKETNKIEMPKTKMREFL